MLPFQFFIEMFSVLCFAQLSASLPAPTISVRQGAKYHSTVVPPLGTGLPNSKRGMRIADEAPAVGTQADEGLGGSSYKGSKKGHSG